LYHWCSNGGVAEGASLVGCGAVLLGVGFSDLKVLWAFKMLWTACPHSQHHFLRRLFLFS